VVGSKKTVPGLLAPNSASESLMMVASDVLSAGRIKRMEMAAGNTMQQKYESSFFLQ
jgi:hypothetical protein